MSTIEPIPQFSARLQPRFTFSAVALKAPPVFHATAAAVGPPGPPGPQGLPLAIQDEGAPLTLRPYMNFAGAGVTATDDGAGNRTVVTIPGGGAQSPWTQNIDGNGFSLTNALNLRAENSLYAVGFMVSPSVYATSVLQVGPTAGPNVVINPSSVFYTGISAQARFTTQIFNPESGGNSGSDFMIQRFNDAGASLGIPFQITRATGIVDFAQTPTIGGTSIISKAQSPWASDIDGGGHSLTNVNGITANAMVVPELDATHFSVHGNVVCDPPANTPFYIGFYDNHIPRWLTGKNGTSETGGNAGSDFMLLRYADDGASLGAPLFIARSNGNVYLQSSVAINAIAAGVMTSYSLANPEGVSAYLGILSNYAFVGSFSNHPFWIYANGAPAVQITPDANVGVGISPNASYKLDVAGDCNITGVYRINGVPISTGGAQTPWLGDIDGNGHLLSNASYVYVNSGVVVGSPGGVNTCVFNSYLAFNGVGSGARWTFQNAGTEGGGNAGADFIFQRFDNASNTLGVPFQITRSSGFIGINTWPSYPAYRVDIVGDVNITGVYRKNGVALKFRTGHTFALVGDLTAITTLPSMFIPLVAGQAATLVGIRADIVSGTSIGVQLKRNGANVGSVITVTPTTATTAFSQALADGDELTLVLSSPVGTPTSLGATLIVEQTP